MPQVIQATGNTYDSITRPVVFGVAKDILKMMGFDENAFLSFKGFAEAAINQNNGLDPIVSKNFFGSDTLAEIEVEESPRQDMLYTMSVLRPDELCYFRDTDSNIYLRPVKQPTQVEVAFKLRFSSKVEAMRWRDDIHVRSNLLRHKNYHRVTYSYPVPPIFMNFLFDVHEMFSKEDPTVEQDFAKYFFKHADKRTTTQTNQSGRDHMVVVPETQVRVLGWFNFDEVVEKPAYDKDSNTWSVNWTYTFIYDKVISSVLFHELVVRQQIIPAHWYPISAYDLHHENELAGSNSNMLHEHHMPDFESPGGIFNNREPVEDTWFPLDAVRTQLSNYEPVFIGLTTLSPGDNRLVVNLNQLGGFDIKPSVMTLILSDRQYVTRIGESMLNISIFGDDQQAKDNQQFLDEDLNLMATGDLNRTPVYRVVISVVKDLGFLSPGAQERAKNNACAAKGFIDDVWTGAAEVGLIPVPNGRCQWNDNQWDYITDLLSPPRPGRPWRWDWPPRVEGVHLHPGYKPGRPSGGKPDLNDINFFRVYRTVGLYTLIARRPKHANS